MIEVKIPKEIRTYKEKFLFGLTFRQTICLALAFLINVPIYIWLLEYIGQDAAGWIVMITAVPLALVGFVKYNGMDFEKLAWCVMKFEFTPQKRKYVTENFYSYIREQLKEEANGKEGQVREKTRKGRKEASKKEKERS